MEDEGQEQTEVSKTVEITQEEKDQEKKIRKEIEKLQFHLEEVDELIEGENFNEIKQVCKRTLEIQDKLNDLVPAIARVKNRVGAFITKSY